MSIKTRHIIALAPMAIIGAAILAGCNTTGCLENRSSIPKAGFYNSKDQKIALDSVTFTGIGAPNDEPINTLGASISSISLPIRATLESTSWVIGYKWKYLLDGTLTDTLSFRYASHPYFASDECGVIYKYQITELSYTTNLVDSIVLADSLITNLDIEQIKIYFRTQESDEN